MYLSFLMTSPPLAHPDAYWTSREGMVAQSRIPLPLRTHHLLLYSSGCGIGGHSAHRECPIVSKPRGSELSPEKVSSVRGNNTGSWRSRDNVGIHSLDSGKADTRGDTFYIPVSRIDQVTNSGDWKRAY